MKYGASNCGVQLRGIPEPSFFDDFHSHLSPSLSMVGSAARTIASSAASVNANAGAFHFRPESCLQIICFHHSVTVRANSHFDIASILRRPAIPGSLNPDSRGLMMTFGRKAIELTLRPLNGIFNSFANLTPFAVVNDGLHILRLVMCKVTKDLPPANFRHPYLRQVPEAPARAQASRGIRDLRSHGEPAHPLGKSRTGGSPRHWQG